MLFCAQCNVKNCAKEFGKEEQYPKKCPTLDSKNEEYLKEYEEPLDRLIAQKSTKVSPAHDEGRVQKTIRFAKECGFKKIGLAFCITLKDAAKAMSNLLMAEGFEVESIICKVGHYDRSVIDAESSCRSMCNPVAQAEMLNAANTDLNIVIGLCVGHDTLFIRHSNAPVTVLIAKDHVYDNAPEEYLKKTFDYS